MTTQKPSLVGRPPAEPWSPLARSDPAQGREALERIAQTDAQRQLVWEMERYVRGEVAGRAVLVAGHRGAGKTTAVLAAMQQVYDRCAHGDPRSPLSKTRPLLVRLHAPTFLLSGPDPAPPSDPAKKEDGADTTPPTAANAEAESLPAKRCLQEMAAGLFPVLLDELARLLASRPTEHDGPSEDEVEEMSAQLVDELSRGVTLGELREFYRILGALPQGLLRAGTAFDELTAINAAAEAYLVVTGTLQTKQGADVASDEQRKSEYGLKLDGKGLVRALTPVSAAIAAAAGFASGSAITALFVSAAIVLGGMTMSSTRVVDEKRSGRSSRSFVRDNTHESLIRRVPLVVDMLRAAGFPAVFVVDELDKVDDPAALLDGVLGSLKSYVTERALFCFLVDREYYAQIDAVRRATAQDERYGVQHTYFTRSIYVVSRPKDLHAYLRRVLAEDERTEGEDPKLRPARGLGFAFMRLALLHRARLHPYDLRRVVARAFENREFEALWRRDGVLVRTRERKYEAFIQLCIEWVLAHEQQRRQIASDPFYAQRLYDLLFGVSAAWKRGKRLLPDRCDEEQAVDALPDVPRSQRALLKRALVELFGYLRVPASLWESVQRELDPARLHECFAAGEHEPSTDELRSAAQSVVSERRGRDAQRRAAALTSPKYALLRGLDREGLAGLCREADFAPQVDPRGYTTDSRGLEQGQEDRLKELGVLRAREQLVTIGFSNLWNAAVPGLALAEFDRAEAEVKTSRLVDQTHQDVRRSVAMVADEATKTMFVLLLGAHVVAALRGPPARGGHLDELLQFVHGPTPDARRISAVGLIEAVAKWAGLSLSTTAAEVLKSNRIDPNNLADLVTVGEVAIDESVIRPRWDDSVVLRILDRLDEDAFDEPAVSEPGGGAALDLVAHAQGWFPRPLRLWLRWPEPAQWPISVWTDLLAELGDEWPALGLIAAARLSARGALRRRIERAERERSRMEPKVLSWARHQLAQMPHDLPVVVLVNPGPVMSSWPPMRGVSARVVEVPRIDEKFAKDFQRASLVLCELEVPRPAGLRRDQFAIVTSKAPGRRAPSARSDGTIVLNEPPSLEVAIETHLQRVQS